MKRRAFIAGLGAAATWPLVARAQQPAMPVVGFISSRSPADSANLVAAFRKGLGEAGYVEGQNVSVEYRWAEGQYDRLPALAADLVQRGVALLVTTGGEPVRTGRQGGDLDDPDRIHHRRRPREGRLGRKSQSPGGNATGVSLLTTAPESKRLGLLHELLPAAKVVGVLIDPNYQEAQAKERELQDAAGKIDQQIHIAYGKNDVELELALQALVQARADALLVCADPFFDTRRDRIISFAAQHRMPAIYQFKDYALRGGLMSYGISLPDGYRQVGIYAGQILKGAKPADLPIVQSIKFEFVVNLKTAKALGLEIPAMLLTRADEVIE
jgi:putative ABC transport system substrate-binding protein